MKSAGARDKMVAMVKEFFAKHRTFASLEEIKPPKDAVFVPLTEARYIESYMQSLHVACAMGEFPIGRSGDNLVLPPGSRM